MDIRVVTSLTVEDEDELASATLTALVSLLSGLPVSYAVRIETVGGLVVQHTNLSSDAEAATPGAA